MNTTQMNITSEDYLRTIYAVYERNKKEGIKSADIAKELNISRPSVSSMLKQLAKKRYVLADRYQKIFLTESGKQEARKIMHKHRVIEVFLTDTLGHDIDLVHEEAHNLEHAFSDRSIEKLEELLNNPKISPTGRPIPHAHDGEAIMNTTLDKVKKGQEGRIMKVNGKGETRKRILEMGVVKGAKITVMKVAPLGDPIELKIKGYLLSLRKQDAKDIEVAIE